MHNVVKKQMSYSQYGELNLPHNHGDQLDPFGQLIHNSKHAIEQPAEWLVCNESIDHTEKRSAGVSIGYNKPAGQ